MRLLALDTATELCSAALWLDGELHARELPTAQGAAELILPMIDALLVEAGVTLGALDAIAFGRGPGSFTGVRLAASVAQGLGFAAGRPLIPISDLRALAAQALLPPRVTARVLACQDARMAEVYWGCYERNDQVVSLVGVEAVSAPARVALPEQWSDGPAVAAGSGFGAYPELRARLAARLAPVLPELKPRAAEIAQLAAADGLSAALDPQEAQPVYLRDDVARPMSQAPTPPSRT